MTRGIPTRFYRWRAVQLLSWIAILASVFGIAETIVTARGGADWPVVTGRAMHSDWSGFTSPAPVKRHGLGRGGTLRRYRIKYSYVVDGIRYEGDSYLRFDPRGRWGDGAVRVYYSPRDPSQSTLTPGVDSDRVMLFGGIILTAGFVAAIAPGAAGRRHAA